MEKQAWQELPHGETSLARIRQWQKMLDKNYCIGKKTWQEIPHGETSLARITHRQNKHGKN